jgi:hypothetical protein
MRREFWVHNGVHVLAVRLGVLLIVPHNFILVNILMLFHKFTISKQDINSFKIMGLEIYSNKVGFMSSLFDII